MYSVSCVHYLVICKQILSFIQVLNDNTLLVVHITLSVVNTLSFVHSTQSVKNIYRYLVFLCKFFILPDKLNLLVQREGYFKIIKICSKNFGVILFAKGFLFFFFTIFKFK